jgi:sodium-coupled neutral amino acid transporter 1
VDTCSALDDPLLLPGGRGDEEAAGAGGAGGGDAFLVIDLEGRAKSSTADSVWNLCNVILGAGLYALPRVFAALGLLGGAAAVGAVAWLTYASVDLMLRASEALRAPTYARTLRALWGRRAAVAVHLAVVLGCAGFVALYIIIAADVLVGNERFTGIIADLFPALPDPLPWYGRRAAVVSWITLAAVPLLGATSMHGMAATSAVSVVASVASVAGMLALWGAAAWQGELAPARWLPDPALFGGPPALAAARLLSTLPTVMTAFVCHMSIHPLLQDLRGYTPRRMRAVVARSLGACGAVYAAMGAAGVSVFGSGVAGNVLYNVQPEALAPLLGGSAAAGLAASTAVKGAVGVAMLSSVSIILWSIRSEVLELLHEALGRPPSAAAFGAVTYASLAFIYALCLAVEDAYAMVGLVGATCGIAMAFLFPGLIALRPVAGAPPRRALGWTLLGLGALLMAAGLAAALQGAG